VELRTFLENASGSLLGIQASTAAYPFWTSCASSRGIRRIAQGDRRRRGLFVLFKGYWEEKLEGRTAVHDGQEEGGQPP